METDCLQHYSKFKNSVSFIKHVSEARLKEARDEKRALEKSQLKEVLALQESIDGLERGLKSYDQEAHTLKHYKDNDYPKQVMRIAQLKACIHAEKEKFDVQSFELEQTIAEEEEACEQQADRDLAQKQMSAARESVDSLSGLQLRIQSHNNRMIREIAVLKDMVPKLTAEVSSLKADILKAKSEA